MRGPGLSLGDSAVHSGPLLVAALLVGGGLALRLLRVASRAGSVPGPAFQDLRRPSASAVRLHRTPFARFLRETCIAIIVYATLTNSTKRANTDQVPLLELKRMPKRETKCAALFREM